MFSYMFCFSWSVLFSALICFKAQRTDIAFIYPAIFELAIIDKIIKRFFDLLTVCRRCLAYLPKVGARFFGVFDYLVIICRHIKSDEAAGVIHLFVGPKMPADVVLLQHIFKSINPSVPVLAGFAAID